MKIKLFFKKVKLWFIERWKEFQSIQRDKKEIKTMHQVNKVEFSKKHPTYTIVTRVLAVLAALSVAIGFTCASCRSLKDYNKHSTVTASAEDVSSYALALPDYLYFTPHITGLAYYSHVFGDIAYDFILPTYRLNTSTCLIDGSYTFTDYRGVYTEDFIVTAWYNNLEDFQNDVWNVWYANYNGEMWMLDEYGVELTLVYNTGTRDIRYVTTYFSQELFGGLNFFVYHIDIVCGDGTNSYEWRIPVDYDPANMDEPFYYDGSYGPNCNIISFYQDYPGLYNSYQLFWNDGYNYGQSLNAGDYDLGFEDGYNLGFDDGEQVGYNNGLSVSLSDVTPWQVIVDGVNRFFGLSILGNSVTIGMIISIGFGCILIGFAIKIFLGG